MTNPADLTREEQARLCSGADFWHTKGVPRLGIQGVMLTDGPHGLRRQSGAADHVGLGRSDPATCFPTAAGLAASWDPELVAEIGAAIAAEARAAGVAVVLGPGMNIKRSPLCGRNFEYFSEDPLLSGRLAAAFVRAVENCGVGTSVKHYVANNQETRRMVVDVVVDDRALREIYLRTFEIAIREGRPSTVMCAYNRLGGTYLSDSRFLLTEVLRDEWGFDGLVVSDWGATNDRVRALEAGMDLEMPSSGGVNDTKILRACADGRLDPRLVERSAARVLRVLERTGTGGEAPPDFEEHHRLARRAAATSSVLLKNEGILPLSEGPTDGGPVRRVAVIGAFAKKPRYQGSGSSRVNPTRIESAWDALTSPGFAPAAGTTFAYAEGYDPDADLISEERLAEAVRVAAEADVAVVFVGLTEEYESEGIDRVGLDLPTSHNALVDAVAAAAPRTLVVLSNGAPVLMPWAHRVPAILETYLGGQASGGGVADLLFGVADPEGRLAETFPLRTEDDPTRENFPGEPDRVVYGESIFVGYRYYASSGVPVLFPFGHGLSYTSFEYRELDARVDGSAVRVAIRIANVGRRAGVEVVQIYRRIPDAAVLTPALHLAGFRKLRLNSGEDKGVELEIDLREFSYWDGNGFRVEAGIYELAVGASAGDLRLSTRVTLPESFEPAVHPTGELRERYLKAGLPGYAAADRRVFSDLSSDSEAARLFGRPLERRGRTRRRFHLGSTLREVSRTAVGRRLYAAARKELEVVLAGESSASGRRLMEVMVDEMPLRNMITMSGGNLSEGTLVALLDLMNRRILRGALGLLTARRAAGRAGKGGAGGDRGRDEPGRS